LFWKWKKLLFPISFLVAWWRGKGKKGKGDGKREEEIDALKVTYSNEIQKQKVPLKVT